MLTQAEFEQEMHKLDQDPTFKDALRELDDNPTLRHQVSDDPAGYLKSKGISLPSDVECGLEPDNWCIWFCQCLGDACSCCCWKNFIYMCCPRIGAGCC